MNKSIVAKEILAVARILSSPVITAAPNVEKGGPYQVNMSVVKHRDSSPPYIKLVMKEIKLGGGTVDVRYIRNDMAGIFGTGTHTYLMGTPEVPVEALTRI